MQRVAYKAYQIKSVARKRLRSLAPRDEIPRNAHEDREMTSVPGFGRSELDIDPVTQTAVAVPAGIHLKELMNLDELCADVMKMHKDEDFTKVQERRNVDTNYEFAWTGM